jgi:hypothetical protein
MRGRPLRRSVAELTPSPSYYQDDPEFLESHRRGEILVAAVLNAFLEAWHHRMQTMSGDAENLDREWVSEEASTIADLMLTMSIRAIDYTPPMHLEFPDYLSAMITADYETRSSDRKYQLRHHLLASFRAYGIEPSSRVHQDGRWGESGVTVINKSRTRFESFQRDRDEVFRSIWDARTQLQLPDEAYTRVLSVRPSWRTNPADGFVVRETVVELLQTLVLEARDLGRYGIEKPTGMEEPEEVHLAGGVTLIFDEFGDLKYEITKSLPRTRDEDRTSHNRRLEYLFRNNLLGRGGHKRQNFGAIHRKRAMGTGIPREVRYRNEVW